MTRHINRLWNYIVKGLLGTLGIILVFPLVCLLISCGSLAVTVTAIFW